MKKIEQIIKKQSPLIARISMIDTFHCSQNEYLKIRRKELKRKAIFKKDVLFHAILDFFYPFSKSTMEKLWGAVYIH